METKCYKLHFGISFHTLPIHGESRKVCHWIWIRLAEPAGFLQDAGEEEQLLISIFSWPCLGKKKKKHYHLSQCQPAWPPSLTNQYSCTIFRLSQPKIHQAKHHPVPISCLLLNPVPVDSIHSYKKKKQRVRLWDRTLIRPTKTGYV